MNAQPLEKPKLARFGNPVLRLHTKKLSSDEINSLKVQKLISVLTQTIVTKKYGVGLAASQIGEELSVALIDIKPTKTRPKAPIIQMVIINPRYEGIGNKRARWEGCLSSGTGANTLFARVPRYNRINATWHDETGKLRNNELTGIVAHVFQHETDHLEGILFVDKVKDTNSYMLADEYKKRIVNKEA